MFGIVRNPGVLEVIKIIIREMMIEHVDYPGEVVTVSCKNGEVKFDVKYDAEEYDEIIDIYHDIFIAKMKLHLYDVVEFYDVKVGGTVQCKFADALLRKKVDTLEVRSRDTDLLVTYMFNPSKVYGWKPSGFEIICDRAECFTKLGLGNAC